MAGCGPGRRLGDKAVVDEDQRCHWRQQCAGQMPCPDYRRPHSELKTPSWMDAALWCFKGIGWAWLGYLRVSTNVFGKESNVQFKYPSSCHEESQRKTNIIKINQVIWEVPMDAIPGVYRLGHRGFHKNLIGYLTHV